MDVTEIINRLTRRQLLFMEVLGHWVNRPATNQELSRMIDVSETQIKEYVKVIKKRLECSSRHKLWELSVRLVDYKKRPEENKK